MTANEMRNDDGHKEGRNDAGHCERCPQQWYREKDRIEAKLWGGHEEGHGCHRRCTASDERLIERQDAARAHRQRQSKCDTLERLREPTSPTQGSSARGGQQEGNETRECIPKQERRGTLEQEYAEGTQKGREVATDGLRTHHGSCDHHRDPK